ncbi:MAG: DUF4389 domain-containing protein [Thermoleophilia bacterium]|nr:DUF4389 domain-containing protein [Thermoleophilia bacterium]
MEPAQPVVSFSPDLTRSRLTVFFRPILAIPHILWLYLYGIGASVMFIGHWFVAIFTGTTPQSTYDFLVGHQAYSTRVSAYMLYLTNDWPPFDNDDPYAATLHMPAPREVVQGRASSFFRTLLAIPALFVAYGYGIALYVVVILAWFAIMVTGRMPAGFQRFGERAMTYSARLSSYTYLLQRVYPKMVDAQTQRTMVGAPAVPAIDATSTGPFS